MEEERYIGGREEDPYGVAAPETTTDSDHHVVMAFSQLPSEGASRD